ncbi:MAG: DUF6600 domain-containing protein [Thermoanaerobaculia bacterium]
MNPTSPRDRVAFVPAALIGFACSVLLSVPAAAQDSDIHQTVARISYLSGDVSYSRGDDPDDWQAPAVNVPLTLGDRIYSPENGRAELQIRGGEFIRIAPRTDLAALNLTDEVRQFSLTSGTASVQLRRLEDDETFEVDTPNVAVTFERLGDYRIDVDESGNTRVSCFQGEASVAASGGEVPLRQGEQMWIDGIDNPQYDVASLGGRDSWDNWVMSRESRYSRVSSYRYVNFNIGGVADLEEYGRWDNVPGYGRCWTPSRVDLGWQPYQSGRWMWEDPWGWTWVGNEPWAWAPYHYGRWVVSSSRWYWVPEGPSVAVRYSPALVAFVGGGPGGSLAFGAGGGGYVGWFPLGPRDPFYPWWEGGGRVAGGGLNARFMNRSSVTVVNESTFTSGGVVSSRAVRDPQIVRQIAAAPVIRGPVPVVPTVGSLRVSAHAGPSIARPPAAIAARAVVTRVAPPPAPARFQEKLAEIRSNRGAPVSASAAARLSIESHGGARAVAPVRPVMAEAGKVRFQPRNAQSQAPRSAPIVERRGRPLATMERPIVSAPAAASSPAAGAPARVAPGAVVPPRNASPMSSPEGNVPRTFERKSPPERQPAEAPPAAPPRPQDNWRSRPSAPSTSAPPPPTDAPRRFERRPPPAEQPPAPEPKRFERTPPPGTQPQQEQAPAPTPRESPRRVESAPAPGPAPAVREAPAERPQAGTPRSGGKNPDAGRGKDKADKGKAKDKNKDKNKDKKDEPPPPHS